MSLATVGTSPHVHQRPRVCPIRLSELPVGTLARFEEAHLTPQDRAVLGAIGLTERCRLRVSKAGEPFIVQVRSTRIGLSRAVAEGIMVVPEIGG